MSSRSEDTHSNCDVENDSDGTQGWSQGWNCPTPSLGSPRELGDCLDDLVRNDSHGSDAVAMCITPKLESESISEVRPAATRCSLSSYVSSTRTKLSSNSRAFQPMASDTRLKGSSLAFQPVMLDTRLEAVANAIYMVLASSGLTCSIKTEKGLKGKTPAAITAELHSGPQASSRCYDAVHLARESLEQIASRFDTVALLSKRVQKEERGYSLRASVACMPQSAEKHMCWDLFHNGHCPRRVKCCWYHPQECDVGRVRVSIRCSEEVTTVVSEDQLLASSPGVRHKLSLGDLVR